MNIDIISIHELKDHRHLRASVVIQEINGNDAFDFFVNLDNYLDSDIAKYIISKIDDRSVEVIKYVVSKDETIANIRNYRDSLLLATDVYLTVPDYPLSEEQKDEIRQFRQLLRDIPQQPGFPENVVWPTVPDCIKNKVVVEIHS